MLQELLTNVKKLEVDVAALQVAVGSLVPTNSGHATLPQNDSKKVAILSRDRDLGMSQIRLARINLASKLLVITLSHSPNRMIPSLR